MILLFPYQPKCLEGEKLILWVQVWKFTWPGGMWDQNILPGCDLGTHGSLQRFCRSAADADNCSGGVPSHMKRNLGKTATGELLQTWIWHWKLLAIMRVILAWPCKNSRLGLGCPEGFGLCSSRRQQELLEGVHNPKLLICTCRRGREKMEILKQVNKLRIIEIFAAEPCVLT